MDESANDEWTALPMMLKVEEAASVLRIGRSKAYEMAQQYTTSGGLEGLPVLRMGDLLRVPRAALRDYVMTGRVTQLLRPHETSGGRRRATAQPSRQPAAGENGSQLSLLNPD